MIEQKPAREAPVSSPLQAPEAGLLANIEQKTVAEPPLAVENIQGNILGGFMKDHQMLIFLKITDVADFKKWLTTLTPFIATAGEVLAFNSLFKALRSRRGETDAVKATWVNIAFSFDALKRLSEDADEFTDPAFRAGLADRSQALGDPADSAAKWFVGGPNNEADIVLIVASDNQDDLFAEVARLEDNIFSFRLNGQSASSGLQLIHKQLGQNLPGSLAGHEHFGFLDGVSQPGVRGVLPDGKFLTPRQNSLNRDQGKPGQDLLWPGEFVFGYPGQDADKEVKEPGDNSLKDNAPAWAQDGSFLVFRRLRQDVFGFHSFLQAEAARLGLAPDFFGAKLVGRWPSGAPILRAQTGDNAALADSDCANNNFEFRSASVLAPSTQPAGSGDCSEPSGPNSFPVSPGDKTGAICPFAGHIRKAYPRDDITPGGAGGADEDEQSEQSESDTQTHRLLRRGIPFGEASRSTPTAPFQDNVDRGLLFLAYQTSIKDQFEFVTQNWVNNPGFATRDAGHDPIIGQNGQSADRKRTFKVPINGSDQTIETKADWVIPTGGGYFFSPSIAALKHLSK